jgi:hypothetical protein
MKPRTIAVALLVGSAVISLSTIYGLWWLVGVV